MPGLRDDHAAASALPRHAARLCQASAPCDDPVRKVRPASAAEPPERALCRGRDRAVGLEAGRPSRRLHGGARDPARAYRGACAGGRAAARRRHHVPILAEGRAVTGRIWAYGHDDRPFGGPDPPAASFYASRDRAGEHPEAHLRGYIEVLQTDADRGYNRLYDPTRPRATIRWVLCWAHPRRGFFMFADVAAKARRGKIAAVISPIALEAVRRIDQLFAVERRIKGRWADERPRVRRAESAPPWPNLRWAQPCARHAYRADRNSGHPWTSRSTPPAWCTRPQGSGSTRKSTAISSEQ
ncbi:hypothetical protein MBRA_03756 [Methylobacterium brachiatum]|nr:hypothetical protein MBRA_03756 [Methylobacterium brachiatum]